MAVSALRVTEVAQQTLDGFGYFGGIWVQLVELDLDQAFAFELGGRASKAHPR